jgi:hypothetical protein
MPLQLPKLRGESAMDKAVLCKPQSVLAANKGVIVVGSETLVSVKECGAAQHQSYGDAWATQ